MPGGGASLVAVPQTPAAPTQTADVRRLEGNVATREITGGTQHVHLIAATAGQFLRVIVEPTVVDLELTLAGPDNTTLIKVDFARSRVPESLSIETTAAGDYRLTALALNAPEFSGSYTLRLDVHPPTAQDRSRIVAERSMREAARMLDDGATVQQALDTYQRLVVSWRELNDRYREADALYLTGRAHARLSRPETALEFYERALTIFREIGDPTAQAIVLNTLGVAYNSMSRYDKAIEVLDQAVAIGRQLNDIVDQAIAMNNLGTAYSSTSRSEKAIEILEQALAINRRVKSVSREASCLNGLATAYWAIGRFEKALEYYLQAAALHRQTSNRLNEALSLANVAISYYRMGRVDKALEYHQQALTIHREVKNRTGEGIVLNNMGILYLDQEKYETAIEYLEQALAIAREVKRRVGEANSLTNLGNAYRGLKRYDTALEYYEQALAMQREVRNRAGEGNLLGVLSAVARASGNFDKAAEYSEQSLVIAREVKERSAEATALTNLALAELERNNLTRARSVLEDTIAIYESLRSDIYSPELRTAYFASVQGAQLLYRDLLMQLHARNPAGGFDGLAFETIERARARGLLELLTEAGASIRQGVDASLLDRERALARELNAKAAAQVQLLRGSHSPEQAGALQKTISQLENDYEQVQAQIRRTSPRYAAITQPAALTLAEIQHQVLDPDTLLLEYSLGVEQSYLWVVTNHSISSYVLPNRETIQAPARQLIALLTARSETRRGEDATSKSRRVADADATFVGIARELSEMVLRPAAAQLAGKRLIVIPDGALQFVPFAMLPAPGSNDAAAPPAPLIVHHEIVTLPSASTLAIMRKDLASRKPAERGVALVADPVFSASDQRVRNPARKSEAAVTQPTENQRILLHLANPDDAGGSSDRLVIPRLPFTRQEADRILAVAGSTPTFEATGFKASKATVTTAELGKYRYVHFATHGYLDTERPGFSALVLSMVDERGEPQDGFLRANEIYNLSLPVELVVLSACQTGLGKEIKGEGLVGLTRGFMYAGAARVVVSLWSVSDRATSELMVKFYERMLKGNERPAAALRAAQVEMWRQKQWEAPYYWAGFTLQGEWR
jgi:CHAT domain-containing protein/Tfp pilus assembly protein PilF